MNFLLIISLLSFEPAGAALAGAIHPSGLHGLWFNPAGLAQNAEFSLRFPSLTTPIGTYPTYNSAFSISEIDRYIYSGDYLTDEGKDLILARIGSGWEVDAKAMTHAEIAFRNFGVGIYGLAGEKAYLPRDLFELALYGNELGRKYSVVELESEVCALLKTTLAYGKDFRLRNTDMSLGLGIHYYRGLIEAKILRSEGYLETDTTQMQVGATADLLTSGGGNGFGFDLGIILPDLPHDLSLSFSITDISPGISWTEDTRVYHLELHGDSINLARIIGEDEVLDSDTAWDESKESYRTHLPTTLRFSLSKPIKTGLLANFLYRQGLRETIWSTTKPYFALSLEYRPAKEAPLRWGLGVGGKEGLVIATGYGLRLGPFSMDFAYQAYRGIFKSSKGGIFSLDLGVNLP